MADWPLVVQILADAIVWGGWSLFCGFVGWALPLSVFDHDGPLTRLRPFEADGRFYERVLHIKAWKDHLPEAGATFPGGFPKRRVRRDRGHLERFRTETRRAEFPHWLIPVAWPTFYLWNDPFLASAMLIYAVGANAPCLLVQRYNRARFTRILNRVGN